MIIFKKTIKRYQVEDEERTSTTSIF